jgi:hypothetical protein
MKNSYRSYSLIFYKKIDGTSFINDFTRSRVYEYTSYSTITTLVRKYRYSRFNGNIFSI